MIAWLNGVLDRREDTAQDAGGPNARWERRDLASVVDEAGRPVVFSDRGLTGPEQADHIALNDPKQILDDVASDRAVIAMYEAAQQDAATPSAWDDTAQHVAAAMERVVRLTAAKYTTWPGYQQSWAPEGSRG
ncbi:DUF6221 family protein [Micromonospora tulbaghiae]|uniref:DUF6221 family protein n=1 Tax=Micromonospora tulbaghiae TaxID=479978 RepID=UPI0033F10B32